MELFDMEIFEFPEVLPVKGLKTQYINLAAFYLDPKIWILDFNMIDDGNLILQKYHEVDV